MGTSKPIVHAQISDIDIKSVSNNYVETKVKLKDCQGIRVRNYQHQGNYIARDKVWYQYKDGNAWHGPAKVI